MRSCTEQSPPCTQIDSLPIAQTRERKLSSYECDSSPGRSLFRRIPFHPSPPHPTRPRRSPARPFAATAPSRTTEATTTTIIFAVRKPCGRNLHARVQPLLLLLQAASPSHPPLLLHLHFALSLSLSRVHSPSSPPRGPDVRWPHPPPPTTHHGQDRQSEAAPRACLGRGAGRALAQIRRVTGVASVRRSVSSGSSSLSLLSYRIRGGGGGGVVQRDHGAWGSPFELVGR
ncbi:hypothetical protein F4780DRAFT_469269 [Xylariomycetidae sp. FL0641]|nr:hypothetical protein F4780DRAFT_469269 [Xylariomycetidae sp. FL0641]